MDPLIADLGLAGRVALVTGAASGIGKAAAAIRGCYRMFDRHHQHPV